VAFELPDVPNVPAGTRAPQHQHHLPGEGNLHNVPVVYKARAAVAAVRAGHSSPNSARSGWAERQGRRSTMEDAETVVDDVLALYPELADAVGVRSASFYGVYDGHAGARAAAYLATHLLDVVAGCLIESKARTDEAREAVLARAFRLCDQRLMETSVAEAWEDGSTAVVCLQLDDRCTLQTRATPRVWWPCAPGPGGARRRVPDAQAQADRRVGARAHSGRGRLSSSLVASAACSACRARLATARSRCRTRRRRAIWSPSSRTRARTSLATHTASSWLPATASLMSSRTKRWWRLHSESLTPASSRTNSPKVARRRGAAPRLARQRHMHRRVLA
jgi:hypothetical protein